VKCQGLSQNVDTALREPYKEEAESVARLTWALTEAWSVQITWPCDLLCVSLMVYNAPGLRECVSDVIDGLGDDADGSKI
jgi:hypothetical protein